MTQTQKDGSIKAPQRKGWCPGALRPMETGDGLLVRVKPRLNRITAAHALALSDLSDTFGNGHLDLTQRANLQFRGVSKATLPPLLDALHHLDLLDETPEQEATRNILVSPLTGVDPKSANGQRLSHELETALTMDTRWQALPGKFFFAIDSGGAAPLGLTEADITLRADKTRDQTQWLIGVSGEPTLCTAAGEDTAIETALKLADYFLQQKSGRDYRRMRDLVAAQSARDIFAACALQTQSTATKSTSRPAIGLATLANGFAFANIGVPFGRLKAVQLRALAQSVADSDTTMFHLTPWRTLISPGQTNDVLETLLAVAHDANLIIASDDPRLAIEACPGQPACACAQTETLRDAHALATHLQTEGNSIEPGLIHVSGCTKGCAYQKSARVTLAGVEGCYSLVINGKADDVPQQTHIAPSNLTKTVTQALEQASQPTKTGRPHRAAL